jgi:hypothetical protein
MTQTQTKQKTCAELISARCYDRKEQFENALLFFKGTDETKKTDGRNLKRSEFSQYESLIDYANQNSLDFSYVEPNTFKKQSEGYWRWQLSWGGPSDEFRYYHHDGDKKKIKSMEYAYMDWFDGATVPVYSNIGGAGIYHIGYNYIINQ